MADFPMISPLSDAELDAVTGGVGYVIRQDAPGVTVVATGSPGAAVVATGSPGVSVVPTGGVGGTSTAAVAEPEARTLYATVAYGRDPRTARWSELIQPKAPESAGSGPAPETRPPGWVYRWPRPGLGRYRGIANRSGRFHACPLVGRPSTARPPAPS
jgi:hypothetical protein